MTEPSREHCDYRAQTDASTRTWHLGTAGRGNVCVCGVKLMTPDDARAFAFRVPAGKRNYQTDPDVAKVTCGSCKRNRAYATATAGDQVAKPPTPVEQAARPSRRRASTRTATPAEAGAGLNESAAAQLLVDGVQARARRRAKTGDPRADRAATAAADLVQEEVQELARPSGGAVIEADPETGLPRIKPEYAAKSERVAAAQIAAARAARDAG
jgi:hypothetical protein